MLLYFEAVDNALMHEAFEASLKLSKLIKPDSPFNKVIIHSEKLKNEIDSREYFSVVGKIEGSKPWQHDLYRHEFSISTDRGKLDTVEIRCDRKRRRFDFVNLQALKIPKSWGQCALYVYGETNSNFYLHEHTPSKALTTSL